MATKNKPSHGNEIFFVSIMTLLLAPNEYKLVGVGVLWLCLVTAAVIDWARNTKRGRRITRRVASCSCDKVRDTISQMHVPHLLQVNCTVCGAKAS